MLRFDETYFTQSGESSCLSLAAVLFLSRKEMPLKEGGKKIQFVPLPRAVAEKSGSATAELDTEWKHFHNDLPLHRPSSA